MSEPIVTEELTGTRDGITQLQRRWMPPPGRSPTAAMLVVHGVGEHSGRYHHLGRSFARQGYDVLAFDSRGHGQSGGSRGHIESFAELLNDVEDLIVERHQLGLPVVLLGHSLGGMVSAAYAVSGRPRPDLLVLSSPALRANLPRWQLVVSRCLSGVTPSLFVPTRVDATVLSRDEAVQQAYLDDPLLVAGATARFAQEVLGAMRQTAASIDRITLPTYVLHGDDDRLVPPAASAPLAELPNVTYRRWPGLRHECFNEPERAEVLADLAAWLSHQLGAVTPAADGSSATDRE